MNPFDPTEYKIGVQRRIVDDLSCFVGNVSEFPDVEVYEDSYAEAYESIVGIIADLHELATANGQALPPPMAIDHDFSGRIALCVPRWLHHRLDLQAKQNEVSLNTHLCALLVESSTRLDLQPSVGIGPESGSESTAQGEVRTAPHY